MAKSKVKQYQEAVDQYLGSLLEITLRLVKFGKNAPQGVGSGFIWRHGNRHTLVTALHSFQPDPDNKDNIDLTGWHIESDIIVKRRSVAINVPALQCMKRIKLDGEKVLDAGFIDLAWGDVDLAQLKDQLQADASLKGKDIEFSIYPLQLTHEPHEKELYAFCAQASQPAFSPVSRVFLREIVYELGMKYAGVDDCGLYRFVVDGKHKGDEIYRGSSGAPIADESGNVVAVVHGGIEADNVVLGVPLNGYAEIIEKMI